MIELTKETNRLSSDRLEREYKKNMEEFDRKLEHERRKLEEAIFMIAELGGYLNRASDGYPGCTVMWRGLGYLAILVTGYQLA